MSDFKDSISHMSDLASEVLTKATKHQEAIILEQLNELVSRGLLVIEQGPQTLVTSRSSQGDYVLDIKQSCRLLLKDQEYLEALEKENKELKEKLATIKGAIKNV